VIARGEQIAEAQRELDLRRQCYPQWIKSGKLERGDLLDITISTLERLADVLSVSTDYLLGRKDEALPPAPQRPRQRTAAPVG
jgi:transcriptional regulator with XRE-family HTH domain